MKLLITLIRLLGLCLLALLASSCAILQKDLESTSEERRIYSTENNPFANQEQNAQARLADGERAAERELEQQQRGGLGGFFRRTFAGREREKTPQENELLAQARPVSSASPEAEKRSLGGGIGGFFRRMFGGASQQEETQEILASETPVPEQQVSAGSSRQSRSRPTKRPRSSAPSRESPPAIASSESSQDLGLPPLPSENRPLPTQASNPELAEELLREEQQRRAREALTATSAFRPPQEPSLGVAPPPAPRESPSTEAAPRQPELILPPSASPRPGPNQGGGVATPSNPLGPLQLP